MQTAIAHYTGMMPYDIEPDVQTCILADALAASKAVLKAGLDAAVVTALSRHR